MIMYPMVLPSMQSGQNMPILQNTEDYWNNSTTTQQSSHPSYYSNGSYTPNPDLFLLENLNQLPKFIPNTQSFNGNTNLNHVHGIGGTTSPLDAEKTSYINHTSNNNYNNSSSYTEGNRLPQLDLVNNSGSANYNPYHAPNFVNSLPNDIYSNNQIPLYSNDVNDILPNNNNSYLINNEKLVDPISSIVDHTPVHQSYNPLSYNTIATFNIALYENRYLVEQPHVPLIYNSGKSTNRSATYISSSISSTNEEDNETRSHSSASSSTSIPVRAQSMSSLEVGHKGVFTTDSRSSVLKSSSFSFSPSRDQKARVNKFTRPRPTKKKELINSPCPYENCKYDGIFATKEYLNRHIREQHTQQKIHYCSGTLPNGKVWGCGRGFKRPYQLVYHWKGERSLRKCSVPANVLENANVTLFSKDK